MYRFSKPVIFILLFAFHYSTVALDFAKLRLDINDQELRLRSIEVNHGYLSPELIEPLDALVRLSLLANRLSDVHVYMDRALQIVRLTEGLHNPRQYPFLKSAIQVEMDQGNWKDAKEKLNYLKWLVDNKHEGTAIDRVSLLRWIVETHVRGFYEDEEESEAEHLINATVISEKAVIYSQVNGLAEELTYLDLLLKLSNSYLLEAEGIKGGGSTSYRLRRLGPPQLNLIEKRSEAVEKRYRVGLEKLNMIRELSSKFFNNELEAKSMADLYIARWQDYFDRVEEHDFSISRGRDGLIEVGHEPSEVNRLVSDLSKLPTSNLLLTFREVTAFTAEAGDLSLHISRQN